MQEDRCTDHADHCNHRDRGADYTQVRLAHVHEASAGVRGRRMGDWAGRAGALDHLALLSPASADPHGASA